VGVGRGVFDSKQECADSGCGGVTPSPSPIPQNPQGWDCVQNRANPAIRACVYVGFGIGSYNNFAECKAAGCEGIPPSPLVPTSQNQQPPYPTPFQPPYPSGPYYPGPWGNPVIQPPFPPDYIPVPASFPITPAASCGECVKVWSQPPNGEKGRWVTAPDSNCEPGCECLHQPPFDVNIEGARYTVPCVHPNPDDKKPVPPQADPEFPAPATPTPVAPETPTPTTPISQPSNCTSIGCKYEYLPVSPGVCQWYLVTKCPGNCQCPDPFETAVVNALPPNPTCNTTVATVGNCQVFEQAPISQPINTKTTWYRCVVIGGQIRTDLPFGSAVARPTAQCITCSYPNPDPNCFNGYFLNKNFYYTLQDCQRQCQGYGDVPTPPRPSSGGSLPGSGIFNPYRGTTTGGIVPGANFPGLFGITTTESTANDTINTYVPVTTSLYSYNTSFVNDTTTLANTANLTEARYNVAGLSGNSEKGYFAGGNIGDTATNLVDKLQYSTDVTTASTASSLPAARSGFSAVSDGTEAGYFAGGKEVLLTFAYDENDAKGLLSTFIKLLYSTDVSTASATLGLTQARKDLAALNATSEFGYFMGGYTGNVVNTTDKIVYKTAAVYNPNPANLTSPRSLISALDGNGISGFTFYGYTGVAAAIAEVISFTTDVTTAINGLSLLNPRFGAIDISDRNAKGFIIGGSISSNYNSALYSIAEIYEYNTGVLRTASTAELSYATSNMTGVSAFKPVTFNPGGNGMYVAGGYVAATTDLTEKIIFGNDFSTVIYTATLSQAREFGTGLSATCAKGYFVGGRTTNAVATSDLIEYSTDTTTASTTTNLTSARFGMASVSNILTKGYIAGGTTGSGVLGSFNQVTYSTDTTATSALTLSTSRYGLVGISNYIIKGYFAGGTNNTTYYDFAEVLTYSTETLSSVGSADLSLGRAFLAGVDGNYAKGYFAGGSTSSSSYTDITDKITFGTDTTVATTTANLTVPRTGCVGGTDGTSKGYVTGGSTAASLETNVTEKINYPTDVTTASVSASLGVARTNPLAVSPNCPLTSLEGSYYAGGTDASGTITDINEKITYAYDSASTLNSSNLTSARTEVVGCSGNSIKGYFVGSASQTGSALTSADKMVYSIETTTAQTTANLVQPRFSLASVYSCATAGYLSGGSNPYGAGTWLATTERITYSTDTNSSQTASNLTQAKYGLAGVSDILTAGYYSGGFSRANWKTTDKLSFSTETAASVTTAELSVGRRFLAGCDGASNGAKGYFAGGFAATYTNVADALNYATDISSATASANLSINRQKTSGSSERLGKGYFAGGDTGTAINNTDKLLFSTDTTAAQLSAKLGTARTGLASISVNPCMTNQGTKGYFLTNTALVRTYLNKFDFTTENFVATTGVFPSGYSYGEVNRRSYGISSGTKGVVRILDYDVLTNIVGGDVLVPIEASSTSYYNVDYSTDIVTTLFFTQENMNAVATCSGDNSKGYFSETGLGQRVPSLRTKRFNYSTDTIDYGQYSNLQLYYYGRTGVSGSSYTGYFVGGYYGGNSYGFSGSYNSAPTQSVMSGFIEKMNYTTDTLYFANSTFLQKNRVSCASVANTDVKAYITSGYEYTSGFLTSGITETEILNLANEVMFLQAPADIADNTGLVSAISNQADKGYFWNGVVPSYSGGTGAGDIDAISFSTDTSSTVSVTFIATTGSTYSGISEFSQMLPVNTVLPPSSTDYSYGSFAVNSLYLYKFSYATESWSATNMIFWLAVTSSDLYAGYEDGNELAYLSGNSVSGYIATKTKVSYATEVSTQLSGSVSLATDPIGNAFGNSGFSEGETKGYFAANNTTSNKISKLIYSSDTASLLGSSLPAAFVGALYQSISQQGVRGILAGIANDNYSTYGTNPVETVFQLSYTTDVLSQLSTFNDSTGWNTDLNVWTNDGNVTNGYISIGTNPGAGRFSYANDTFTSLSSTLLQGGTYQGNLQSRPFSAYFGNQSAVSLKFDSTMEIFTYILNAAYANGIPNNSNLNGSLPAYFAISPYPAPAVVPLSFANQISQAFDVSNFYVVKLKNGKMAVVDLDKPPTDNFVAGPFADYTQAQVAKQKMLNNEELSGKAIETTVSVGYKVAKDGYSFKAETMQIYNSLPKLDTASAVVKTTEQSEEQVYDLGKPETLSVQSDLVVKPESLPILEKTINPKDKNEMKIIPTDSSIKIDRDELLGE
jgi:hypothetical protein